MSEITAVPLRPVQKGTMTRLWIGVAAAVLVAGGIAWAGTAKVVATTGTAEQFLSWHSGRTGVTTTPSGLQYQVVAKGRGAMPTDADVVLVNYKGSLRDGSIFDQAERAPFPVTGVVPGFSEALKLMNKGAKYRFWIPPALGYGETSPDPKLPAHSVLVFDVELIDFKNAAEVQAQMQQMQAQQARAQQSQGQQAPGGPVPGMAGGLAGGPPSGH
ncbi:FKBP-type peptidyl-prolyl cis-trans isomerase [Sphingomonas sp.]|uniref:FKBP-type peptidyl-prolyl cis-trans isomerase n=1 Tax=Sphingomonas sp. TaxID=28214 RepID=UPI0025E97FD3|nr:FKBP-type peptidyl-prolyl cis-trans isomerase [Sphingomonas sp.]